MYAREFHYTPRGGLGTALTKISRRAVFLASGCKGRRTGKESSGLKEPKRWLRNVSPDQGKGRIGHILVVNNQEK